MRVLLWPLLAVMPMSGTALAAPGDPYVVYTANSVADGAVILRTDPGSGSLVEISRNGPQGTLFRRPYDLAVEADGNLVVADLGVPNQKDGAVIRVDPRTGRQSLVSSGAEFFDPAGIAVSPDGQLYVVDNRAPDDGGAVIRVDPRTGVQTLVTERSDQPGRGELDLPFGIAVEHDGNLVVSNRVSPGRTPAACRALGKVVRVDPVTGRQEEVDDAGNIAWPLGLAVGADGDIVVANECARHGGLVRVDRRGGGQAQITPNSEQDVLVTPERIAVDPGGALLVSDFNLGPGGNGGIVRVDPETGGQTLVHAGELFNHPLGIAAVVNRPPSATLTPDPPVVAAGRPVRLDATRSGDPEQMPLAYEWDLDGDGGFEAASGATAAVSRSFAIHGPATVRVRVNDPHGGQAVAEASVLVDGAAPVMTQLRLGSPTLGVRRAGRRGRRGPDAPRGRGPRRGEGRPGAGGGTGGEAGRRGQGGSGGEAGPRQPGARRADGGPRIPGGSRADSGPREPGGSRADSGPREPGGSRADDGPRGPGGSPGLDDSDGQRDPRGERRTRGQAAARQRRHPPRETTIGFTLSEPATVTVAVDRGRSGRRPAAGGPCRVSARHGRRCIRWSRQRLFNHAGVAGANAVRLRARGLRPGRHRLVLTAVDAVGNGSAPRRLPFRVVSVPR